MIANVEFLSLLTFNCGRTFFGGALNSNCGPRSTSKLYLCKAIKFYCFVLFSLSCQPAVFLLLLSYNSYNDDAQLHPCEHFCMFVQLMLQFKNLLLLWSFILSVRLFSFYTFLLIWRRNKTKKNAIKDLTASNWYSVESISWKHFLSQLISVVNQL